MIAHGDAAINDLMLLPEAQVAALSHIFHRRKVFREWRTAGSSVVLSSLFGTECRWHDAPKNMVPRGTIDNRFIR